MKLEHGDFEVLLAAIKCTFNNKMQNRRSRYKRNRKMRMSGKTKREKNTKRALLPARK